MCLPRNKRLQVEKVETAGGWAEWKRAVASPCSKDRNGKSHLHARTYVIEASTNLVDWEPIGVALEDEQESGEFSFEDYQSDEFPARYYRVVTP